MELDKNIFISQPAAAEAHRLNLAEGQVSGRFRRWSMIAQPIGSWKVCKKKNGF